ncbi:hypothetical protein B0H10DRAFT_2213795 [Mycena sp. CBHHK59/15]|nr:hypothetical protein B0H10DRAFT_2213795 [Mycena sp. CBHHK59/15]
MAAQVAKEKGNAAFKAGDFAQAVGHYTAALLADAADPTLPLNRAAAYLRLGKNADAERDCGAALALDPDAGLRVKALFRRAQARVGGGSLAEALADLNDAARLEPANDAVKQELGKVEALLAKAAVKKPLPADVNASSAPKRRRVPITIVEDGKKSTSAPTPKAAPKPASQKEATPVKTTSTGAFDDMKPVSSRPLNAPSTSTSTKTNASASNKTNTSTNINATTTTTPTNATPKPTPKPSSFKDAKQARASRVGGGIFRASGESTIFSVKPERNAEGASGTPNSAPVTQASSAPPPVAVEKPSTVPEPKPSAVPEPKPVAAPSPPPPPGSASSTKSPMTLFDFTRAWEADASPGARVALLSVRFVSSVYSTEADVRLTRAAHPAARAAGAVPDVARACDAGGDRGDAARGGDASTMDALTIGAYMEALPGVARFATVVRFLSRAEKAGCVRCGHGWARGRREWEKSGRRLPEKAKDEMSVIFDGIEALHGNAISAQPGNNIRAAKYHRIRADSCR